MNLCRGERQLTDLQSIRHRANLLNFVISDVVRIMSPTTSTWSLRYEIGNDLIYIGL